MNIQRSQHWLSSFDCCFLVSKYERKSLQIEKMKNLVQMCSEVTGGEILMNIVTWFL